MTWIKAEYEFGSLFSYRIPGFSSQYALSSPLPGPSTIKLAIVSTAIETSGRVSYGEEIFDIVKNAEIRVFIPRKVAISNCLIKRLKKKKEAAELQPTFGIRGYVHFSEPIKIYIQIVKKKEEIKSLLKKIRRFGTSDSLAYCITPSKEMEELPPENAIRPMKNLQQGERPFVILPIKDINPSAKIQFKHVNVYDKARDKNVFVNRYYLIPISNEKQGKNWTVYEVA